MSVQHGLNGNDVNWDVIDTCGEQFCPTCEEYYAEKRAEFEEEFDDDEDLIEEAMEKEYDNRMCEGHEIVYRTGNGEDMWGMVHDTNSNFVSFFGLVPAEVFNEDALNEMKKDYGLVDFAETENLLFDFRH